MTEWKPRTEGDNPSLLVHFVADDVNHPEHYTSHPSGVEHIEISRHMTFCCGNVIKYLWRAGLKVQEGEDTDAARLRDLKKALWYLEDEIYTLENGPTKFRIRHESAAEIRERLGWSELDEEQQKENLEQETSMNV